MGDFMRYKMSKRVLVCIMSAGIMITMAACGSTADSVSAKNLSHYTVENSEEAEEIETTFVETESTENGLGDQEKQIQEVQDTLVYMGGLKTPDDAEKSIELAIFRNEQGDLVGIVTEDGTLHYGMFTTEDGKLEDGREYARMRIEDLVYGYYFNDDLVSGILVDTEGNVYDAGELSEDAAREYVRKTLGG